MVEAYLFDKAVLHFGVSLEDDLEENSKSRSTKSPDKPEVTKKKRMDRLAKWLESSEGTGPRRFRDPNIGG